jgi:hypothetical protein
VKKWVWGVVALALLSPVILYMYQFLNPLSSDHQRWAEFGSYIGGIYSPFLSALVLVVLMRQMVIQEKMNNFQIDITHIQRVEKDLEYYIHQLNSCLEEKFNNETLREILLQHYSYCSDENLVGKLTKSITRAVNSRSPKVIGLWMAIYPLLIGLEKNKDSNFLYELSFNGSYQKLLSVLSVGICVSLDNLLYSSRDGSEKDNYFFRNRVKRDCY